MKKRSPVILYSCLMVLLVSTVSMASTTLYQLGRSPFYTPPLTSTDDLKAMVSSADSDIKTGFAKAGYAELYHTFLQQFPSAEIDEIEIGQGQTMMWMFFRKQGKGPVRVARDVTWAGEEPFKAFRFYLTKDDKRYQIVVPRICGNLALKDITDVPPEPVVEVPPNQDPECRMNVTPERLFCGEEVTIDASGSSDRDGTITSVSLTLTDGEGKVIEEKTITEPPFIGKLTVPCGGTYTVRTKVTDDKGAVATSPACEKTVAGIRRLVPVAAVGYMYLLDPASFIPLRGGLEYWINENFSLMGMLGYNFHIDGSQGDDALSADILGLYHFSRYSIGAGVGWWNMDDDSKQREELDGNHMDLILQAGVRVYGEPDAFNITLFGEGRSFVDNLDNLHLGGRVMGGLLFRF